ncbi:interleukin-20 receptor subunit beta isoform X1 [Neofelis nebulosa]|uniref:interleukin-20 receptor subunit beta isoform X1 n=1 Tax=Neofelis nebulosa TaxID=61452 RepID=UPI0027296DBD|nr:interleukin-20 receptor subunit beta isoform X1 [Neofelis nebulosa]
MWFFYTLIPCLLIDGVAILPAPQNLSVQSTNMKHLLTWSPVMVPGEIIYYFVEYQGEYESLYMSHVWIPSSWCSPTKGPECDITDDITATVPYNLRVRATQGSETSAWSTLKPPFNRNSRTCQSGEEQGHSGAPGNHGTRGCILCEGPDIREGHRETQPFQPGRMCQGARRDPPPGAGPVWVCWLHADPRGCAPFHLENGPAAPALLLPRGGASRHLENNQFTPEVNQLQEGRGRSLCHCHAVFGGTLQDLDLAGFGRAQLKLRSWLAWHRNKEGKGCGSVFLHGQRTRKARRACWVHV